MLRPKHFCCGTSTWHQWRKQLTASIFGPTAYRNAAELSVPLTAPVFPTKRNGEALASPALALCLRVDKITRCLDYDRTIWRTGLDLTCRHISRSYCWKYHKLRWNVVSNSAKRNTAHSFPFSTQHTHQARWVPCCLASVFPTVLVGLSASLEAKRQTKMSRIVTASD